MSDPTIVIRFQDSSTAMANRHTQTLREAILGAAPTTRIDPRKQSQETMDFGTVLGVVLAGPAVVAVANGIRSWLEKYHGVELEFETADGKIIAKNVTAANVVDILKAAAKLSPTAKP